MKIGEGIYLLNIDKKKGQLSLPPGRLVSFVLF